MDRPCLLEAVVDKQTILIKSSDVTVRPFAREDILPSVDYLTGSSEEYWRERGVDKSKMQSREQLISNWERSFNEGGGVPNLASIVFRGVTIGIHSLTHIAPSESALFHAHIFKDEYRRMGIGIFSYLKAAEYFFKTLQLKKIIFKTPKLNMGANRVKEKIGIPRIGETIFDHPIFLRPLAAYVYELDRDLLEKLKAKHGL